MIYRSIRDLVGGRALHHVGPDTPIVEACRRLEAENIGALGVCDGEALVGIVSERDVIGLIARQGGGPGDRPVREIMTPDPVTIDIDASLADAQDRMKRGGFRHLPVTENGRVVSMISFRDIPTEYRLMHERFAEYREGEALAVS